MRIIGGRIERFGFYRATELAELGSGLVLVAGDNESGKTTLLEFIRQTLFGYKEARQHPYYDSGGQPEGSLLLRLGDGRARTLVRRGARGGAELFDPDGHPRPSAEVDAILGGMTDEGFRNLFAITLDELRALDAKDDAAVEALLLGASFGVSPAAYNRAARELKDQAERLLKLRGRTQPANAAAIACKEALAEARRIGDDLAQFSDKARELEELRARVDQLEHQDAAASAQANRAGRLVEAWPAWTDLRRKRQALAGSPEIPDHDYDEAIRHFDGARIALGDAVGQLAEEEAAAAQAEAARDAAAVDEALLGEAPAIRTAIAGLSGWRIDRQRAEEARQDAAAIECELAAALGQLDLPKDESGLQQALRAQTGVQATNLLAQARDRMEAADATEYHARRAHEEAVKELGKAELEVRRVQEQIAAPPPEPPIAEDDLGPFEERRVQARSDARDAEARASATQAERQQLERSLARIAPDWSLADLAAFDPIAARAAIAPAMQQAAAAESDAREAARALELAQSAARAAATRRADAEARARGAVPGIESLDAAEERLRLLRDARAAGDAAAAEAEAGSGPRRLSPWGIVLAILSIVPFAGAAVLLAIDLPEGAISAAIVGVLLLAAGLAVAVRGSGRSDGGPAARRRDEALARIGLLDVPEAGVLEEQASAIEAACGAFREAEALAAPARAAQEQADAADARRAAANQAWQDAREALAAALDQARIPASARDDATGFLMAVDGLRRDASALERAEAEGEARRAAWRAFAIEVRALDPAVAEDASPDAVDAAAKALVQRARESLAARGERQRLVDWIESRRSAIAELRKEAGARRAEVESAGVDLDAARAAWREVLERQGFDPGLDPEGAMKAQALAEEVRKLHGRRIEVAARAAKAAESAEAFEGRCAELLRRLGRRAPQADALEPALHALETALEEAVAAKTARDRAEEALASARDKEASLAARIEELRRRQADLLADAGCGDFESLQRQGAAARGRAALRQQVDDLRGQALALSGEADEERLAQAFADQDLESLERRCATLQASLREIRADRDAAIERRRDLERELERLRGEKGREDRLAEAESHRARARAHARQWLRARLALWMLEKARRTFERDHQPAVLVEAGKLFHAITGGKWLRITRSVEGSGELSVHETKDGAGTPAAILSRGAREQLYFALRLANALQPRAQGEPLPLVLDDVLVNFDEGRARESLRALAEAARGRQILLFTCHNWVRALVEEHAEGAQVVRLEKGAFAGA